MKKKGAMPAYHSIDERLNQLENKGLIINNRNEAVRTLRITDSFRILRFTPLFEDENERFKPGTTFSQLEQVYQFDRYIRHIMMQCIDPIEIALRAQLSELVGSRYGSDGYMHKENFAAAGLHKEFYRKLQKKHQMRNVYEVIDDVESEQLKELPVWVAFELCTLQMLELFFENLQKHDKKAIAHLYDFSYRDLPNWLHFLVVVRNTAAHQGRFINRTFNEPAKLDRYDADIIADFSGNDLFAALYVCSKFLGIIDQDLLYEILTDIQEELTEEAINSKMIGFPENWYHQLLACARMEEMK